MVATDSFIAATSNTVFIDLVNIIFAPMCNSLLTVSTIRTTITRQHAANSCYMY